MAEKIEGTRTEAEAAEAMSGVDVGHDDSDYHLHSTSPDPVEVDFDARLEELKRRMGES